MDSEWYRDRGGSGRDRKREFNAKRMAASTGGPPAPLTEISPQLATPDLRKPNAASCGSKTARKTGDSTNTMECKAKEAYPSWYTLTILARGNLSRGERETYPRWYAL